MPFFRQIVTFQTRLTAEEVERRLQRVVRRPRTLREVLQRRPVNAPEHPDFIGFVGNGRFRLNRLHEVPSSFGRFYSVRPSCRGVITPTVKGSEIKINFSDPGLSLLAVGLSSIMSLVIVANTRGWPLWQVEHAIIVFVVTIALGACRFSLHQDVEKSMSLLRSCLSRAK